MKLQDYISYYIGCDVIVDDKERGKLLGAHLVPNSCNQIYYYIQTEEMLKDDGEDFCMPYNDDADESPARIKPILRRLEDITPEETGEMRLIRDSIDYRIKKHAAVTHYLLKLGFDLFGLIDARLAINQKLSTNSK